MSSGWAAAAQAGMQLLDTGIQFGMGELAAARNKKEAAKNRQFQYDMYTQRYKYTMADMKAAGLNPLLAYQQGTGGGMPSGSTASFQPSIKGSTSAKDAIASSLAVNEAEARIKALEEQAIKTKAEGYKTDIDAANAIKYGKILDQQETSAKAAATRDAEMDKFYQSDWGKIVRQIELTGKGLNPFADAATSAKGALTK